MAIGEAKQGEVGKTERLPGNVRVGTRWLGAQEDVSPQNASDGLKSYCGGNFLANSPSCWKGSAARRTIET